MGVVSFFPLYKGNFAKNFEIYSSFEEVEEEMKLLLLLPYLIIEKAIFRVDHVKSC